CDHHFRYQDRRRIYAAAELEVAAQLQSRKHLDQVRSDGDLRHRLRNLAVAHHEAGCAPAVIARDAVHALPDKFGDQHGFRKRSEQLFTAPHARLEVEIAGRRAGASTDAACGMAGRRDAELTRRGAVRAPAVKSARGNEFLTRHASPFTVEPTRAKTAHAQRIVDDRHPWREDLCAELVLQEARAPSDRCAVDRSGEMTKQARSSAGSGSAASKASRSGSAPA